MEGMNAVELSLIKGRFDVIVSVEKLDWKSVVEILREAS